MHISFFLITKFRIRLRFSFYKKRRRESINTLICYTSKQEAHDCNEKFGNWRIISFCTSVYFVSYCSSPSHGNSITEVLSNINTGTLVAGLCCILQRFMLLFSAPPPFETHLQFQLSLFPSELHVIWIPDFLNQLHYFSEIC